MDPGLPFHFMHICQILGEILFFDNSLFLKNGTMHHQIKTLQAA